MTLLFIRVFFLIISSLVGCYIFSIDGKPVMGVWVGVGCGFLLVFLERSLQRVSVRGLSSMVFGLLLGVVMAKLIADILTLLPLGEYVQSLSRVILTLIFSYLGAVMALRGKDEFHLIIPYVRFKREDMEDRVIILDTSAIIDGRIMDIYKTNFFSGRFVVPRFVLHELQQLSDSESAAKRQRGRRGMEMLRNMQKDTSMNVIIHEDDAMGGKDVDNKLVQLAKLMDAQILTTDHNLSRIAAIQSISALNLNELVSAVKPVVFPGEEFDVNLLREGKEPNQAISYTEDGTLIVIADGKSSIGKKLKVTVTSVLQTQTGKIIFTKVKK